MTSTDAQNERLETILERELTHLKNVTMDPIADYYAEIKTPFFYPTGAPIKVWITYTKDARQHQKFHISDGGEGYLYLEDFVYEPTLSRDDRERMLTDYQEAGESICRSNPFVTFDGRYFAATTEERGIACAICYVGRCLETAVTQAYRRGKAYSNLMSC